MDNTVELSQASSQKEGRKSVSGTALVVLFKKGIEESQTLQSLHQILPADGFTLRVIVWDNSPVPYARIDALKELLPTADVIYKHTSDNWPLSKIYNYTITNFMTGQRLYLFDDDSTINDKYFLEVVTKSEVVGNLALPQIYSGGSLVSPGRRIFFKGKRIRKISPGKRTSRNMLAINSGMSISADYAKKFRYDERLMFYGTDSFFMHQYSKDNESLYVLESSFHHALSEDGDEPLSRGLWRFTQQKRAWQVIYGRSVALFLFIVYQSIKNSIKHRTIAYLRW